MKMITYQSLNENLADRAPGWVAVKPLRTHEDYEEAMAELHRLAGCPEDTAEEDLLIVLSALVNAYEADQWG